MKRAIRFSLLIALILPLLTTEPGRPGAQEGRIEELREAVDSLRAAGDFDRALESANELLGALRSTEDAKQYQIDDAERLVATLGFVIALPDSAREQLAEAARLGREYFDLYGEDDIAGAASLARKQCQILSTQLGRDHPETAKSMNNLAFLLGELGEYDTVGDLYKEVLEIDRRTLGDTHPDVASDFNNLGTFMQDEGEFAAADSLLRRSLDIYLGTFGELHPDVAMVYNNLGSLFEAQGDLAAAEPLYRKSILIYRELYGSVDMDVATGLHNLAALLAKKGNYAAAEALFKETLAIYRELDADLDVALTLNSAASCLHDQDDYAGAERLYAEALKRFRDALGDENEYVAATLNNLAGLYHDLGDYEKAERFYLDALQIRRQLFGPEHAEVAIVQLNLARNYRDWGRYDDAEPLYHEALDMLQSSFGNEHPDVSRCLYSMGNFYATTGDYDQAYIVLRRAVQAYEASRLRIGEGVGRATFQESPYPKLAYTCLELNRPDDAWPAAERALGRVLAELLAVSGRRGLSQEETAREEKLLDDIFETENELAAYRGAAHEDSTGRMRQLAESARNHLLELQTALSGFQEEIAGKYPLSEGRSYPLARVQQALADRAAIIGWLDIEVRKNVYESWAYLIPARGAVVWARVAAENDGDTSPYLRTRAYRDELAVPTAALAGINRDAAALWSERIEPLGAALNGIDQLIVVPSGAMLGIPVGALVDDDGMFMAERYTLSYAPSATLYAWLEEKPRSKKLGGRVLLVGDPPFCDAHLDAMTAGVASQTHNAAKTGRSATLRAAVVGNGSAVSRLPRLEGTRAEVKAIASLAKSPTVLLGAEASEIELARLAETGELGEFGVIHVATHALIDDRRPERSALVLSQVGLPDPLQSAMKKRRIMDGLVTAREIVREWNLSADIVTLSACETGLGLKVGGEGYIGFSHAFLQAGARSLLVSLWKVEDRATSLLMQKFYENYFESKTGTKAVALRNAQMWLKDYTDQSGARPYEHPFYWSGFILIGDPGRTNN